MGNWFANYLNNSKKNCNNLDMNIYIQIKFNFSLIFYFYDY
jgi:hypothetical protein